MKNHYVIEGPITKIFCTFEGKKVETIIDTQDLMIADSYPNTWYVKRSGKSHFYVTGIYRKNGKQHVIYLHRLLTNCPKDKVVDHINHDTLDNRRSNLRVVSQNVNAFNCKGNRGVGTRKDINKYRARIMYNGKEIHLGYFDTREEALEARRLAEIKYYGFTHGDDIKEGIRWGIAR
jgi:HNH endonuclease